MSDTMKALKKEGYSPFYLYGGGHNKTGVEAYINAVKEVYKDLGKNNKPDHIFLASGTGSTQAGILLGLEEVGWNSTSVHGISIARNKKLGFEKISEAIQFKNQKFDLSKIIIYDDYRFGGYGISNLELKNFTFRIAKEWGIILDTTY